MLNFNQFVTLTEQKYKVDQSGNVDHSAIFGNHVVNMHYHKSPGNQYYATMTINGQTDTDQVLYDKHKQQILNFAHDSIDSFIPKHKPTDLYMVGHTTKKRNLYHKVANKLAKKHGGVVTGQASVRFDWTGNDPVVNYLKKHRE